MSERIEVGLGTPSYDIHIGNGVLAECGALLKPFMRGRCAIVTDSNVAPLYLDAVLDSLRGAGLSADAITLPPGEQTKSFGGLEALCSQLLDLGIERGGLIVALGGGVIGDLTGFAGGIVKRGIDFAQIPTTLLAAVDSSVGGKTAIDTKEGKNLIGMFHQPRVVIADTGTLCTLPPRELRSGYAEVVKYGALGDADFFAWLEQNGAAVLNGDADARTQAVARSCRMKAAIVARDERESGDRALLNLGHTFGHALEAACGYSGRLTHGEGVAIGMALAFGLSMKLGLCPESDRARLVAHLEASGLLAAIADIPGPRPSVNDLLGFMARDKKAAAGHITFILVRGLGHAFATQDVPESALREILAA